MKHHCLVGADLLAVLHRVFTVDPHVAFAGFCEPFEDFEGRGFPRTVGAEEPEDLPGDNIEVDAVHGGEVSVAPDEVSYFDD